MDEKSADAPRRKAVKVRLTDRAIRAINPPRDGAMFVYDSEVPYFGLRTLASGTKAFVYGYRNKEGRLHRVTLGRWPTLTATAARLRAREMAGQIANGRDPHEELQERKSGESVEDLVDLYCSRHLNKLRTGVQTERFLRTEVIPWFGKLTKAASIRRRDIVRMVERKAVSSPISANRLLTATKRLCNWAVEKDLLDGSPAAGIKRPTKEKTRDRVLSETEILEFWTKLPAAQRMTEGTRVALKLILILAQRPGEVCAMEWTELDLAKGWWELPREKTKSDRTHRVPLSDMALDLIRGQPKADPWVFPSVNGQSLRRMALSHAVRRNGCFGLARWTPHDLRRTAVTHMGGLEVDRFVIERVLNHVDDTVGGIYDRYSYDKQKRRALNKWERRLKSIIGGSVEAKVVEFSR